MNRPKFRVWDIEEQKWYKPTFKAYKKELHDIQIELNGDLSIRTFDEEGKFVTIHESMFRGRYEVIEFTGLFDKNGTEIFEGDIVKFKNPYDKRSKARGIIVWREDKACFGIDMEGTTEQFELYRITAENYLTVIGNIYQSEHLLRED